MAAAPAAMVASALASAASAATRSAATPSGPDPDLVTILTRCPRSASARAIPDPIGPAPTTTCSSSMSHAFLVKLAVLAGLGLRLSLLLESTALCCDQHAGLNPD